MTHTKGPWIASGKGVISISEHGNFYVCSLIDLDSDQDKANACLIAAAPEILEALEALFEHCAMTHKHWGEGSNQREADAAITAGRAAIAKAKGSST
jgi:hypothetical protein